MSDKHLDYERVLRQWIIQYLALTKFLINIIVNNLPPQLRPTGFKEATRRD